MIRIGIVGCGNIAHTLAGVMTRLPEHMRIEAVAARDGHRARSFADEFGVAKAYGSYEELYSDDDVDLVYVATPHSHHMQCMLDALSHGRHVLCEKAFCVNARQAEAVFALARERHLFVAEAIWTRYMPSRRMISDIIESGRIGRVTTITANLGYSIIHKPRIADPALGGGALLDIGVYPLNFVLMAREGMGVRNMMGSCVKSSGGVDVRGAHRGGERQQPREDHRVVRRPQSGPSGGHPHNAFHKRIRIRADECLPLDRGGTCGGSPHELERDAEGAPVHGRVQAAVGREACRRNRAGDLKTGLTVFPP